MKAGHSAPTSAHKLAHFIVMPGDVASKVRGSCWAVLKKCPVVFSKVNSPPSHVPTIYIVKKDYNAMIQICSKK